MVSVVSVARSEQLLRGHHTLALYELTVEGDALTVSTAATDAPFVPTLYSQFKYGLRPQAERYGALLAAMLQRHFAGRLPEGEQIVVVGTPYKRIPNAAKLLAVSAERHLRAAGLPTLYTSIFQHRLVSGDYGTLPAHERDLRNKHKRRSYDPDDFTGRHVVVIDDVWITGSIGRSIIALLQDVEVLSLTVANLVRLDPVVAAENPQLEDRLNHCTVKNLHDLHELMTRHGEFTLTTRAVKFILQANNTDLIELLQCLSPWQIAALYDAVIDEGYDQMQRYGESFQTIRSYYP